MTFYWGLGIYKTNKIIFRHYLAPNRVPESFLTSSDKPREFFFKFGIERHSCAVLVITAFQRERAG